MSQSTPARARRGIVAPLVAISLIALVGMVGLAIDLGMVMVAKTQAQAAADVAAMTGARSLNGASGGNVGPATTNAQGIATANYVLGKQIQTSAVTVTHGAYHYDTSQQAFYPVFPPPTGDNYGLTQAVVTPTPTDSGFSRIWGITTFNVTATAIAAHRPRDITLVLDYSGSMNNESDLWVVEPDYGSSNQNTTNNADSNYPQFGPYNTSFSPLCNLLCTSTDPRVGRCNMTTSALGIAAMPDGFYANARGGSASQAFSLPPATVTNTSPGGDTYLINASTSNSVLTWSDVTGGTGTSNKTNMDKWFGNFSGANASNTGYNAFYTGGQTFKGYTQGPSYWGNTFFIWPPDPNTPSASGASTYVPGDWRKRFFYLSDGATPLNDNTKLFVSGGGLNAPPGNYVINYKAILAWIKNYCVQSGNGDNTKPFPQTLRSGNILYYSSIPSDVPTAAYNHSTTNTSISWTTSDQRFWKEYIDWVLGVWRDPYGNIQGPATSTCSIGGYFTPGSSTGGSGIQVTGPDAKTTIPGTSNKYPAFIDPLDNPKRPRHTFWFGPMTMAQFMTDTGLLPGTATDISMYSAKTGIQGALNDIQNNHPNDLVSLILYSRPVINASGPGGNADPPGVGAFTNAQIVLSNNFPQLSNALYFPPNSSSSDVGPYDSNGSQTPRAHGDYCSNTATGYGFMLAYNQYSGTSYSGNLGGLGRTGASKLVILETDGMANVAINANFTQNVTAAGANDSYWDIGPAGSIWLDNPGPSFGAPAYSGTNNTSGGQHALNMAARLCALTTDTTNGPGFATPSKPVLIHCIAFGAVLEPVANPPSQQADVMALLNQISSIGQTGFPPNVSASTDPNYYKLVIGNQSQRQTKMKTAFINIMDSDVPVSLVK